MCETAHPKTALVVEGGGMRGVFTSGVLDAFLESSFDPFSMYYGVSVGASALSSFLAGQQGRHFKIFTEIACKPEFMSLKRMFKGGSFMDLDGLWENVERTLPLNTAAIDRHLATRECRIVCTSVRTGMPVYIHPKGREWIGVLKASSSIPFFYRHFPAVGDEPMADGGISDPIPVMAAYRRGARHVVVVRTRPEGVRKRNGTARFAGFLLAAKYPGLGRKLMRQAAQYNHALDFMDHPPKDLRITQIFPGQAMKTKRTSVDAENLFADYCDGLLKGRACLKHLKYIDNDDH